MPDDPYKLAHATVRYGKGHAPEFCRVCRHYEKPLCSLVASPIEPDGWCKLWAAIPKAKGSPQP